MVNVYSTSGMDAMTVAQAQELMNGTHDNFKDIANGNIINSAQLVDGMEIVRVVKAVAA